MIARIRSAIFAWNWRRSDARALEEARARAKARLQAAEARRDSRSIHAARADLMAATNAALAGGKR